MSEKIFCDPSRTIDRYREAKANRSSAGRINRAVHTNHFSERVYEWSTGISRIDRRIGLYHVDVHARPLALRCEIAPGSTDNSSGYAWLSVGEEKSIGISDGNRPFTDKKICRAAQWCDR